MFTGHSLGGAMTFHAASDLILSGIIDPLNVQIYTYGQPRVGNHQFTDTISSKVSEWYRVIHNKDIVAHIPPCIPDLHYGCIKDGLLKTYLYHAPQEIFYDETFSMFTECDGQDGEDLTCSNHLVSYSINDHTHYWGHWVGHMWQHNEIDANQTDINVGDIGLTGDQNVQSILKAVE